MRGINVRIYACVAMLDRLCGKPQPMTVTGQDPEAAPPGVVYVPLKAGD